MVVNANDQHRHELAAALSALYEIHAFDDAGRALDAAEDDPPDVIVVDERPLASGLSVIDECGKRRALRKVPVIVTGKSRASGPFGPRGLDVFLHRPVSKNRIIEQVSNSVSLATVDTWESLPTPQNSALQKSVQEFQSLSHAIEAGEPLNIASAFESCAPLAQSINEGHYNGILSNVRAHHNYTYVHSLRVATFLSIFGHGIGMRGHELHTLATGGLLHDVGKMATPQDVLNKKGMLVEGEWEVMRDHVLHTREILGRTPGVTPGIRIIAEQHHEKLDGSGYPDGLGAKQMNELARMSAIIDIFGALTDARSYKPAFAAEKAFSIMEDMPKGLDQRLVRVFREILEASGGAV